MKGITDAYGCEGPTVVRCLPFSGEYMPSETPFEVAFMFVYVWAEGQVSN